MNKKKILNKAIDLISDPSHWVQESFAATDSGVEAPATSLEATKWCAYGAVKKVSFDEYGYGSDGPWCIAEDFFEKYGVAIIDYNDSHTHEEIITALRGLYE